MYKQIYSCRSSIERRLDHRVSRETQNRGKRKKKRFVYKHRCAYYGSPLRERHVVRKRELSLHRYSATSSAPFLVSIFAGFSAVFRFLLSYVICASAGEIPRFPRTRRIIRSRLAQRCQTRVVFSRVNRVLVPIRMIAANSTAGRANVSAVLASLASLSRSLARELGNNLETTTTFRGGRLGTRNRIDRPATRRVFASRRRATGNRQKGVNDL